MKIKKEKIKEVSVKIALVIAERAFLACLILFLISLALGFFLFNEINVLKDITEFENLEDSFFLDNRTYENVIDYWEADKLRTEQAGSKEYSDPFYEEEEGVID